MANPIRVLVKATYHGLIKSSQRYDRWFAISNQVRLINFHQISFLGVSNVARHAQLSARIEQSYRSLSDAAKTPF